MTVARIDAFIDRHSTSLYVVVTLVPMFALVANALIK